MDIILRQKLSLLINLARVDGHFAPEEKELIKELASAKGLEKEEIQELLNSPDTIESLGALSRTRKKEYLIDSIRLMLADGKIEESERNFCKSLATKLMFDHKVVDHIVNKWSGNMSEMDLSKFQLSGF